MAESNLHVTVKFLGQTDDARIDAIGDAVRAVARRTPAFEVHVRGLGAFPTATRARVVWVGLAPPAPLAALAAEVDAALAPFGVERESRPFAAHVTLGRVRESRRNPALADALARPADCGRLAVTRIALMRSELHPRGARYTELASVLLAGAISPVE